MHKKAVMVIILIVVVLSLITLAFMSPRQSRSGAAKIAVIYVDGIMIGGRGEAGLLGASGGTDAIIRQLHAAKEDATVKAILLRINSPGGSAPASQEVGEEIKKVRQSGKIIVTSMADMAASGGYWLAATTDKIYANPATLTGSIGVYIPYANWQELYQKIGIYQEKIKSGPHKDMLAPERSLTPAERAIVQSMVDDLYEQFVQVVAQGRNLDPEKVRQLADGRIYTGNQAKALGLVDELGNMYDALEGAKQLAGLSGKVEIKEYGEFNPWSLLFGSVKSQISLENMLYRQLRPDTLLTAPLAMPQEWQVQ
ncbi:signal peptide peptidase SppA [Acetonema longum]|uniref:Signal peptide peptidase A n=1 Tax=Acetonema longum DSM 6540 TaxID=1009370 RepID=F7NH94_9FIRM|nr:signal peptide peptidase SppA [Acetonema longum]EGO64577.1 signal peptide peptidase A [Acetonema longum DSM 6540]